MDKYLPLDLAARLSLGRPDVSCAYLPALELRRRQQRATALADAKAAAERASGAPGFACGTSYLGRAILWHEEFPAGLRLHVCDADLFSLTAQLPAALEAMNDGQALDPADFGYLADVLRQLLADCRTAQEALNLSRALAWAEWEGDALAELLEGGSRG